MKKGDMQLLRDRGAIVPCPESVWVSDDVDPERIEPGAVLLPGVFLEGAKTLLGRGCTLGPGGRFSDVRCGRDVRLASGNYENCVFLDGAGARSGAEIRGGALFMEKANAAHTAGCKMTVLGIGVTLGSLINFCDVFVSGGEDAPFGFTEIGTGAVHYNFTPNALKFGSLIGPGAAGEMFGLFPRTFVGGQTQIIAPTTIASGVLIPAGTSVRKPVKAGMLCVQPPLTPAEKPYCPELISQAREKFLLTALLIAHYRTLRDYFEKIREPFARRIEDSFLERLCGEARAMLDMNVEERVSWLFEKNETGQRVDFFAKLGASLRIWRERLSGAPSGQISGLIEQIRDHESLLHREGELRSLLGQPLPAEEGRTFAGAWEDSTVGAKDHLSALRSLPAEAKALGRAWLEGSVERQCAALEECLEKTASEIPSSQAVGKLVERLAPFLSRISSLNRQKKLLVSGNFAAPGLGVIDTRNLEGDVSPVAWQLLSGMAPDLLDAFLEKVLDAILAIPHPAVIRWPALWGWIAAARRSGEEVDIVQIAARSCFRLHGTDGLRGAMSCPASIDLEDAVRRFALSSEVTPELFSALARNTIRAWEITGRRAEAVVIGRDTRDLYADDHLRSGIFYRAVCDGALSTGVTVYDLGILPIPAVPYFMAHCHLGNYTVPDLALYKSASHNPASQDGIKVFGKASAADELGGVFWHYRKASAELEMTITALLLHEALGASASSERGKRVDLSNTAREVFEGVWAKNLPNRRRHLSFLALDLAHGAFAEPGYREILASSAKKLSLETAIVGDRPNGRNINNNEGCDRVGAAHLENVEVVLRSETEPGGAFRGFPALDALFSQADESDKMAWAVLADGDGDRGYAAFRVPEEDRLQVVGGEKAFFYTAAAAAMERQIAPGDSLAFTVESSVPFVNALMDCLENFAPVRLSLSEGSGAEPGKFNLQITPVGDKYILRQKCRGLESSGHIIAPYTLDAPGYPPLRVWAGNGPISMLHAIDSFHTLLERGLPGFAGFEQKPRGERLSILARPYEDPCNATVAVYFVAKNLWYRGSEIWREIERIVEGACGPLNRIDFRDEPDTLYLAATEGRKLRFTVLARPSGTENKMSVKLYGTRETRDLFSGLAEELFRKLFASVKDRSLPMCRQEFRILELLAQRKEIAPSELAAELGLRENAVDRARLMTLIGAISAQKLASYDGTSLRMAERGFANRELFGNGAKHSVHEAPPKKFDHPPTDPVQQLPKKIEAVIAFHRAHDESGASSADAADFHR